MNAFQRLTSGSACKSLPFEQVSVYDQVVSEGEDVVSTNEFSIVPQQ